MATLLRGLCSLRHEVEWVEFEHNDSAPGEIGEHFSALSNAAGLHGQKAALIVWGVEGSTHRVIGTTFRPPRRKTGDEDLEPWLARHLHPAVYFTIRQFLFGSTAVVILKIQPCKHPPVRWKDTKCVRVGINKKKLRDHPEKEHPELALGWRLPQVERIRYDSATSKDAAGGMLRRIREARILIRTILAAEALYTYVGTWWPPGHMIGYEHPFVHAMADFLEAVTGGGRIAPDFHDGVREMLVLGARLESARTDARREIHV